MGWGGGFAKNPNLYFGFTFLGFRSGFFFGFHHYAKKPKFKMPEMSSGGPPGRFRPPAIESVKAKLYWGDHFGEPAKIGHVGEPLKINNFVTCGYKNPKCILVFCFLVFCYGFF